TLPGRGLRGEVRRPTWTGTRAPELARRARRDRDPAPDPAIRSPWRRLGDARLRSPGARHGTDGGTTRGRAPPPDLATRTRGRTGSPRPGRPARRRGGAGRAGAPARAAEGARRLAVQRDECDGRHPRADRPLGARARTRRPGVRRVGRAAGRLAGAV